MGPDGVRSPDRRSNDQGVGASDVTLPPMVETIETAYSAAIVKKAEALVSEGVVNRAEGSTDLWEVPGSTGRLYVVQVVPAFDPDADEDDEDLKHALPWMSCTCPNGANRGGRPSCYHTAAVALVLEQERAAETEAGEDV